MPSNKKVASVTKRLFPDNSSAEESDKSSNKLTIDLDPVEKKSESIKATDKKKRKRKRKRVQSSSSGEEYEDQTFEETIEKCAVKNNLTPECVKKLLKKLVMNDHVLAIVKLKEEEEVNREKMRQKQANDGDDEDDDEDEDEICSSPKLTRLKAKQLNQKPLPIVSLKNPIPDAEVAALIQEELNSDDDDEEYKPGEDELQSDDDHNTTISDIDSLPRTPGTPLVNNEYEADTEKENPVYSNDGLFKIPKIRNDSMSLAEEQENIARRTRSKLCLSTTAIETLESTFVPPDITTDMYDFDCDMDHVWKEFLNEFTKPMSNNLEDDDDTDPEYVAVDKIPLHPEELREVKVSKKEWNDLVSELLEMSDLITVDNLNEATMFGESSSQNQSTADSTVCRTPRSNKKAKNSNETKLQNEEQSETINRTVNQTVFEPTIASTPNAPKIAVPYIPEVSRVLPVQPQAVLPTITYSSIEINPPPQVYYQISKPDASSFYQYQIPVKNEVIEPLNTIPVPRENRRYKYLHNLVPIDTKFSEGAVGFTPYQMQLFQQQLRMHVQFSAQNFIQTYAHPEHWQKAIEFKKFLIELSDKANQNSSFNSWNLKKGLQFCEDWENDLLKDNEENSDMINFIIAEVDRAKRQHSMGKQYQLNFHPKLMERVINSQVFMYPKLLPYNPFGLNSHRNHNIIRAEERLISFGLEIFYDILGKELNKNGTQKTRKPSMQTVCTMIHKYLCTLRTEKHLTAFIVNKKMRSDGLNPIQYYFLHRKAPPYQHVLESVNFDNILPPALYQKGILPYLWDKYLYSNQRIAKISAKLNSSENSTSVLYTEPNTSVKSTKNQENKRNKTDDTNVKITINLVFEDDGDNLDNRTSICPPLESNLDLNPNFSDHSYKLVKNKTLEQTASVSSFLDDFKDESVSIDSSTERSIVAEAIKLDNADIPISESVNQSKESKCSCLCKCGKNAPTPTTTTPKRQKLVTDFFKSESLSGINLDTSLSSNSSFGDKKETYRRAKRRRKGTKFLNDFYKKHKLKSIQCKARQSVEKSIILKKKSIALKSKLYIIFCAYNSKYDTQHYNFANTNNKLINQTYNHIKTIDCYSDFLIELKKMSSAKKIKSSDSDTSLEDGKSSNKKINVISTLPATTKKTQLKPEDANERDSTYAFNFCEKVEETLLGENKYEKYEKFLDILQNFDEAEHKVCDLYLEMQKLFLPEHPELADLFLTFLLPGQAAQIGKFFEHFILTNMSTFLNKLNLFFNKQPAQIKKVYACLNELSSEKDVTMETIKSKILPLLKGNPLLTEWFLQMFPSEKPPENSLSDYEVLSVKKESPESMDVYEELALSDIVPDNLENAPCATKYIQGRIIYGVLPAKLSFLAHDSAPVPQNKTDGDPIRSCVHDIKSYGDAKLHEKSKSQSEIDLNASFSGDEGAEHQEDVKSGDENETIKYKLCDKEALKVHAIRLNPVVHATKGEKFSDLSHFITDPPTSMSDEELKGSPKKYQQKSMSSKSQPKKKLNSPTATKKGKITSPNPTKKLLPTATVPADSKAITVSKKLKTLIDSEDDKSSANRKKKERTRKKQSVNVAAGPSTSQNNTPLTISTVTTTTTSPPQPQPSTAKETTNWTREEDKIILEEIKNGFSGVDELIDRIFLKLENRLQKDIAIRYEFLMEILQKFQTS